MTSRKEQILDFLAEDSSDTFMRYCLAMELQKEGSIDESEKQFRDLMADETPYVPAFLMLGQMLMQEDRNQDAATVFTAGIETAKAQGNEHAAGEMAGFLAIVE